MNTQTGLAAILGVLSDEFGSDREPPRIVAIPGQASTADWCAGACWSVWVRLDTLFPSTRFPDQDIGATSCVSPLAARWHIGVWRCIAGMDESGEPPDAITQTEDAAAFMDDADRIRCAVSELTLWPAKRRQLGSWFPMGPFGNCAGGYWPVTTWQMP